MWPVTMAGPGKTLSTMSNPMKVYQIGWWTKTNRTMNNSNSIKIMAIGSITIVRNQSRIKSWRLWIAVRV